MQKILTAINNPELNSRLKADKDFNVYENDIQYKEAIIDILEEENNFDIIIIYEKLPGEISIIDLVKKIKSINNKINFIFIFENENKELEKELINENIKNIFYNKKLNFNQFILEIKNNKLSEEEKLKKQIENLEKIISNKNKELLNYKNNFNNKKLNNNYLINNNLKNNKKINNNLIINKNKLKNNYKIITLYESKINIELINNNLIYNENKKIIIIDFNNKNKLIKKENNKINYYINKYNKNIHFLNFNLYIKNNKINNLFFNLSNKYDLIIINLNNKNKYEKYFLNISEEIIFILDINLNKIKELNNLINNLISKYSINKNKINILLNNYNKNSINYKIIKNIFLNCRVIKKLNKNNLKKERLL